MLSPDKRDIVFFDIDGPLVRGLTQESFIWYLVRKGLLPWTDFARLVFGIALYKMHFLKDPRDLFEIGIRYAKGRTENDVQTICNDFLDEHLPRHLLSGGVGIIREQQEAGREVVLLSSIIEPLAKAIGDRVGVARATGTRMELSGDRYTGRIDGRILHGEEKAAAVQQYLTNAGLDRSRSWAYTDHESDEPLLEAVAHPFVVNATSSLQKIAQARQWSSLSYTAIL